MFVTDCNRKVHVDLLASNAVLSEMPGIHAVASLAEINY